eukprot:gnl/TRDRNA2_/TRDRNA2_91449_c0_seq2.p1 gnl/TRDRNA2_/TRDRNA2_91449_c0~~gnl/TRDRNA2_/TRDRNA2_91449_c0_seq2.p1  ORF type:complete len:219 (-),score=22.49 gnl/TRDRNA2_/TRDRNA2_91449_c0_seq2:60-716(-)
MCDFKRVVVLAVLLQLAGAQNSAQKLVSRAQRKLSGHGADLDDTVLAKTGRPAIACGTKCAPISPCVSRGSPPIRSGSHGWQKPPPCNDRMFRGRVSRSARVLSHASAEDAGKVGEATVENFQEMVLASSVPVLVDLWAPWCGPCKMLTPTVEQVASEYAGKARVFMVNIDEHKQIAIDYGVKSIPTILVFKSGKLVDSIIGAVPKSTVTASLDNLTS